MAEETSLVCSCQLNHLQRRFNVLIRDDHQTREERCLAENVRKKLRHLMETSFTRHVLEFATTSSHLLLTNETGILYIVMGRRKTGTVDGFRAFRSCAILRGSRCFSCHCLHERGRFSLVPVVFRWPVGRHDLHLCFAAWSK